MQRVGVPPRTVMMLVVLAIALSVITVVSGGMGVQLPNVASLSDPAADSRATMADRIESAMSWSDPYGGYRRGVALAGGSFNDGMLADGRTPMTASSPGMYGRDWFYDVDGRTRANDDGLRFLGRRGVNVVRVDFRWERLQPRLNAPLDDAEVRRLTSLLDAAAANDLAVILDCHNYGHYKTAGSPDVRSAQGGWPIGSQQVSATAFADLWRRVVTEWGDHPAVWGWELMNEPVAMGASGVQRWQRASQRAVEAIRATEVRGSARAVLVGGYDWSKVQGWASTNGRPWIADPLGDPDRLLYTAHHYWDGERDSSYGDASPRALSGSTRAHANTIVAELKQFTSWLRRHDVRGAVTEVGWPDNAAATAWNIVAEQWYREADAARLHVTAWASGAAWGDYELAIYEARPGSWSAGHVISTTNVQARVLEQHLSSASFNPRTRAH